MIIKERNPADHPKPDKFAAAGAKAEERMAHYLKRAFGEYKDVWVFNDLRIVNDDGDDHAQIDHLVFYRRGMIVIESKSVSSQVAVNAHGEWTRTYEGKIEGMESPILQARRQVDFLRGLLNTHRNELRGKVPLLKRHYHFNVCPMDVLVAISDKGTIERHGIKFPDVMKAERIVERVKKIMDRHKHGLLTVSFNLEDGIEWFPDSDMERIRYFLLARHDPRVKRELQSPQPVPPREAKPPVWRNPIVPPNLPHTKPSVAGASLRTAIASTPVINSIRCRYCKGDNLQMVKGYNFHFLCDSCSKKFAADYTCTPCGAKATIRRDGFQFIKDCEACGRSDLYYVNQRGRNEQDQG